MWKQDEKDTSEKCCMISEKKCFGKEKKQELSPTSRSKKEKKKVWIRISLFGFISFDG